jgi:hypothetical protein
MNVNTKTPHTTPMAPSAAGPASCVDGRRRWITPTLAPTGSIADLVQDHKDSGDHDSDGRGHHGGDH